MPLYDYVCPYCGLKAELLQSVNDPSPPPSCECGHVMARQQVPSKPPRTRSAYGPWEARHNRGRGR